MELYFDRRVAFVRDLTPGTFPFTPNPINSLPRDVDGANVTYEIDAGTHLIVRDQWLGSFDGNASGCILVLVG